MVFNANGNSQTTIYYQVTSSTGNNLLTLSIPTIAQNSGGGAQVNPSSFGVLDGTVFSDGGTNVGAGKSTLGTASTGSIVTGASALTFAADAAALTPVISFTPNAVNLFFQGDAFPGDITDGIDAGQYSAVFVAEYHHVHNFNEGFQFLSDARDCK